jgi:hypothetical protein
VTLCSLMCRHQNFGGTHRLHLQRHLKQMPYNPRNWQRLQITYFYSEDGGSIYLKIFAIRLSDNAVPKINRRLPHWCDTLKSWDNSDRELTVCHKTAVSSADLTTQTPGFPYRCFLVVVTSLLKGWHSAFFSVTVYPKLLTLGTVAGTLRS